MIIAANGSEISETAVFEAARLVAYYNKARENANVPVDYALVKYVSNPSGEKLGMVIHTHQKTICTDSIPEHRNTKQVD